MTTDRRAFKLKGFSRAASISEAQANAFIEKPFKMQQLYDLVNRFRRD